MIDNVEASIWSTPLLGLSILTFGIVAVFWEALPPAFLVAVLIDPQRRPKPEGKFESEHRDSKPVTMLVDAGESETAPPSPILSSDVWTMTEREKMPEAKEYVDLNIITMS